MPAHDEPFTVTVYDKNLTRVGWVGDPEVLVVTPRHNQQPTAALTVAGDHKMARVLASSGTRVVIHHEDEHRLGGPVRLKQRQGAGVEQRYTFQIADDWRLLDRILAWQLPTGTAEAQNVRTHDVRSGPAETVVKGFLEANAARLGLPVTIAPDQGRGNTITVSARMQRPADVLLPLIDQAGIGVTVRQTLTGFVVDCYEPTTWPLTLSEDAGTLIGNNWSLQPPEVTRVVVGAGGEDTARVYRQYVNTVAEVDTGDVIEEFVDARDIKVDDPALEALMAARGAAALAEGAAKAGLALEFAETETFRYGRPGVLVGDELSVELAPETATEPALPVTEVLRSATLTWSREGVAVTPVVGDRTDDPTEALVRTVSSVARALRTQQAGV